MELVPLPVATAAAWVLTVTFAWAVAAKFVHGSSWPAAVRSFGFHGVLAQTVVFAVPLVEAGVVVLFAAGALRAAAALTLALVAAFSGAIVRARASRAADRLPCGCFGSTRERDYRVLLARNSALALVAAAVLLGPRGTSLRVPDGTEVVPLILIIVGGALIAWMAAHTAALLWRR